MLMLVGSTELQPDGIWCQNRDLYTSVLSNWGRQGGWKTRINNSAHQRSTRVLANLRRRSCGVHVAEEVLNASEGNTAALVAHLWAKREEDTGTLSRFTRCQQTLTGSAWGTKQLWVCLLPTHWGQTCRRSFQNEQKPSGEPCIVGVHAPDLAGCRGGREENRGKTVRQLNWVQKWQNIQATEQQKFSTISWDSTTVRSI